MQDIQCIIKNYHHDGLGIGNVFKCLISALSVNDDTVIECYDDYMYGNYQTILDDKFIFKTKSNKDLERVNTCRLLVLKEEENLQDDIPNDIWYMGGLDNPKFHHLFSFSKRIDWNYDPDKLHTVVKQRIFKAIDKIIFKPDVLNSVEALFNMFKDKQTLGLSIRTWKASHETNVQRAYNFETYKLKLLDVLKAHPDINHFVVSIDNHAFLEEYERVFNELNMSYTILTKSDTMNDIQYAIIKALTLAKCNYFIGNRISTFSELVFWFSKHTTKVFPVF